MGLDINSVVLKHGAHKSPAEGLCFIEAAAFLAKEPHSDKPACVCPVIAEFGRRLNDRIASDETRTVLLRPRIAVVVGTKGSRALELRRAFRCADWVVRTMAPFALEAAGRPELAATLRGVTAIVDAATALAARDAARGVQYNAVDAAYAYAAADAAAAAAYAYAYAYAYDADDAVDDADAAASAAYAYAAAADDAACAYAAADAYAYAAARLRVLTMAAEFIAELCAMKDDSDGNV